MQVALPRLGIDCKFVEHSDDSREEVRHHSPPYPPPNSAGGAHIRAVFPLTSSLPAVQVEVDKREQIMPPSYAFCFPEVLPDPVIALLPLITSPVIVLILLL